MKIVLMCNPKHHIMSLWRSTSAQEEAQTFYVPVNLSISLGFAGKLMLGLPGCHLLTFK